MQVHSEEGIARANAPPIQRLPVGCEFRAIRLAMHTVTRHLSGDKGGGHLGRIQEFERAQIIIVIEKQRGIERRLREWLQAIAQLVSHEFFRLEFMTANQRGRGPGGHYRRDHGVIFRTRWRSHRSIHRRPKSVIRYRCPK